MSLSKTSQTQDFTNEIEEILQQELECFQNMLDRSKEVIENSNNSLSFDSVHNLLKARKYWIELLQGLEIKRKKLSGNRAHPEKVKEEISQIARTLVAIDAKILDILNMKKLKLIQDISNVSDNKSRNRDYYQMDSRKSKLIDIIQE